MATVTYSTPDGMKVSGWPCQRTAAKGTVCFCLSDPYSASELIAITLLYTPCGKLIIISVSLVVVVVETR